MEKVLFRKEIQTAISGALDPGGSRSQPVSPGWFRVNVCSDEKHKAFRLGSADDVHGFSGGVRIENGISVSAPIGNAEASESFS